MVNGRISSLRSFIWHQPIWSIDPLTFKQEWNCYFYN